MSEALINVYHFEEYCKVIRANDKIYEIAIIIKNTLMITN